jgi:nitrite reductase (NADH) large subunit
MTKQRLVVVGNGMAGARAVEEVLARGGAELFDITMFGDEPYGNYNRILLSNILCGLQDASEIFINPLSWYEENGITLYTGSPVTQIDRASRLVQTGSGARAGYDVLLIATGSRAFIPPMQGLNGPDGKLKRGVFGFRTIDDCDGIIATAKDSARAAVIGGGLLGLEAARGLMNHGCEVHLIHLGGHLMPAQLDLSAGAMLRQNTFAEEHGGDSWRRPGDRASLQGWRDARLRHGGCGGWHPPECRDRAECGAYGGACHCGGQPHAVGR